MKRLLLACIVLLPLLGCRSDVPSEAVVADSESNGFTPPEASKFPDARTFPSDLSPAVDVIRQYESADGDGRTALAAKLESTPGYAPEKLSELLHQATDYPAMKAGFTDTEVTLMPRVNQRITLRIPKEYDPKKAYPLLYVLHGSGGDGAGILSAMALPFGESFDKFVVVAPTAYRKTTLDISPPDWGEMPMLFNEVKKLVHVDSDRVYLTGHSLGGFTSLEWASMHPQEFAGSLPISGSFFPMETPKAVKAQLANLQHVPVLNVWGAQDNLPILGIGAADANAKSVGTLAEANHQIRDMTATMKLPFTNYEHPYAGHQVIQPPAADMVKVLSHVRDRAPKNIEHYFRWLYQSTCYWAEGTEWEGDMWDSTLPKSDPTPAAQDTAIMNLLGHIQGSIEGNRIRVTSTHLSHLRVWLMDGMIDWTKPVEVIWNGKSIFNGPVKRDLNLCLSEAMRSRDFEALRWAKIEV